MLEMTVHSVIANGEIGKCNIAIVSDRAGVWTVFVPVYPPYHLDTHLETSVPVPSVTIT